MLRKKYKEIWASRDAELFGKRRMERDCDEYNLFLRNLKQMSIDDEMNDTQYLEFICKILRKEIKYAAMLEIYRGNINRRFTYPFSSIRRAFTGYCPSDKNRIKIELGKEDVITAPWKESSYVRCSRKLTKENIRYEETKYQATFYEGLDLTIAGYGFHSIAVGIILEQGRINAEKFDVTKIFPYVDVYPDLSFRYNEKTILKRLAEQEHHLSNEDVKLLSTRFYGTDYRLILLYQLCQRKFFIEQGMTDEIVLHTHNW